MSSAASHLWDTNSLSFGQPSRIGRWTVAPASPSQGKAGRAYVDPAAVSVGRTLSSCSREVMLSFV
jgi:hypothetical protein